MAKFKLTPAFIKKFHKFDEENRRLVDVWSKRHSSKKDFTYDEEKFMNQALGKPKFADVADEIKPERYEKFKKASETRNIITNVYGERSPSSAKFTILSGKEDRILRRGLKIQEESEGRFVNRLRSAYKNVALKDPGKFTSKPPRVKPPKITRFAPDQSKYGLKSNLVIDRSGQYHLPKSEKFYEGVKRSMVISRQKNKPTMILTKGIGEGRKPAGFIGPMQKYTGVGKKDYISGQELKLRYDRLSEKAFVHAAAKKQVFLEQARQRGYTFKNVSDKEKAFMRYKGKFKATDEAAEQMGFPDKSPGGQFMPFGRLEKWNPTKDNPNRMTDIEWDKYIGPKYKTVFIKAKKPTATNKGRLVKPHGRMFTYDKDQSEITKYGYEQGLMTVKRGNKTFYDVRQSKDITGKRILTRTKASAWDRLSIAGQEAAKKEEFKGKAKRTAGLRKLQTKHVLYPHEARKELGWLRQLDKAQAKKKKTPFDW